MTRFLVPSFIISTSFPPPQPGCDLHTAPKKYKRLAAQHGGGSLWKPLTDSARAEGRH